MSRRQQRRAFSLAEAIVASVIVAVVVVTAMNAAGSVRKTESSAANRALGVWLAETLMEEIVTAAYMDPATKVDAIGLDAGEDQAARSTLDDVDDYHGLKDEPPTDADGNALGPAAGWSRSVEVVWAQADDPMADSVTSARRKRVSVIVKHGDALVAQLVTVRAQHVPARKE